MGWPTEDVHLSEREACAHQMDEIDGNSFINKVNPKWSGAIPATCVTKQNKKQEELVEKKLHYEEIKEILGKF